MRFVTQYHATIERIVSFAPAADKFVHVQAGLLIWLVSAMLFRLPLRSSAPMIAVICAEAGNEVLDRLYSGSWNWADTIGDIIATLFWPAVLMSALRLDKRLRR